MTATDRNLADSGDLLRRCLTKYEVFEELQVYERNHFEMLEKEAREREQRRDEQSS